jgi:hypothetical protein
MRHVLSAAAGAAVATIAVAAANGSAEDPATASVTKTTRYVLQNVERQPYRDIIRHNEERVGYFVSSRGLVPRPEQRGPWMGMHAALLPRGEIFMAGVAKNAYDDEPTEAIVGGTGAYRGAAGEAVVNYAGTINRLTIRLSVRPETQ